MAKRMGAKVKIDPKELAIRIIEDEEAWPRWPVLPVKRNRFGGSELGVILASEVTRVVICNLFNLPKTGEEYNKLVKYDYPTIQALIDDGWEVD